MVYPRDFAEIHNQMLVSVSTLYVVRRLVNYFRYRYLNNFGLPEINWH